MFTVKIIRPDANTAIDCTPLINTARWSTAMPGGFAAASVSLDRVKPLDIPYLSKLQITYGDTVAWEGLIENVKRRKLKDGNWVVSVQAFGFQRELDRTLLARWYIRRDLEWEIEMPYEVGWSGNTILHHDATSDNLYWPKSLKLIAGQLDQGDTTKYGVRIEGASVALADRRGAFAWLHSTGTGGDGSPVEDPIDRLESRIHRVMGSYKMVGTIWGASALRADLALVGGPAGWVPQANGNWYSALSIVAAATGTFNVVPAAAGASVTALGHNVANALHLAVWNNSGASLTPTASDAIELYNVRTLHTSLTEDTDGVLRRNWPWTGMYGGKIMLDIIGKVRDLKVGRIDPGTDWIVDAFPFQSGKPQYARAYVEQLASMYDKRWAVWEDGVFDWLPRQDDSPEWTIRLDDCLAGTEIDGSVDGLAATVFVHGTYSGQTPDDFTYGYLVGDDALTIGADRQGARTLNPFVRANKVSDKIVDLPFQTGEASADQIAYALANYANAYPRTSGTLVVPADRMLTTPGGRRPAALLRAGEDIVIPDLPMEDLFRSAARTKISETDPYAAETKSSLAGNPGQTTFPIVGTSVDLKTNRVTIEVDNAGRFSDTLLARLAAATRTVTG